jgi:hypothetical protein
MNKNRDRDIPLRHKSPILESKDHAWKRMEVPPYLENLEINTSNPFL